jgi:phosphate-selective porin OprO/OprP
MLDFGAQAQLSSANNALVQDAYVTARIAPEFEIQAGKMKEPVGLERLQSGANLLFLERSYPTQLVPNRDVGLQLQGELFDGRLTYQAGVFNGTADGGSGDFDTTDDEKDIAARLFARPFRNSTLPAIRGLGFGVSGTYGRHEGVPRGYVSGGLQRFFSYRSSSSGGPNILADGEAWRISPQAYWYSGPFGILGEYVISSAELRQAGGGAGAGQRENLVNTGWQLAASWFLTGEENSFAAVTPKHPVTLSGGGGWGAWELAARVGQLRVDGDAFPVFADPATSAREAISYALGVNWHLNRNIKVSLNYEHTDFNAASGNPYDTTDEDIVLGRVQFGW